MKMIVTLGSFEINEKQELIQKFPMTDEEKVIGKLKKVSKSATA